MTLKLNNFHAPEVGTKRSFLKFAWTPKMVKINNADSIYKRVWLTDYLEHQEYALIVKEVIDEMGDCYVYQVKKWVITDLEGL